MAAVAHRLAERWSALRLDDVPVEVVESARHCLLDWLGCALAGSAEPLVDILVRHAVDADGPCTLVGRSTRVPPRTAALVNGAAGHALDYDDTHTTMSGHPTVPVLPAALGLAEHLDSDGARLLTALIAGIEVECRLGALLNPAHYRVGWHATGTLGTFGAAAACAHLLGLDRELFAHALGLAGTQAAGLKASFGTMAKPLHAGKAAADGMLAAQLAAGGFVGNPEIIEASQGLAEAAGAATVDPRRLDGLEERWLTRDTLFKYHAACYLAHASINAARALAHQVATDDIERVEVLVSPDSLSVCNIAAPVTGLEGKFSLRATTAMALLGDDTAALHAYRDDRMADPELVAVRDRVRVIADPGRPATRSKVLITTRSGEVHEAEDDTGRASPDLERQWEQLTVKFQALAEPVAGADRTEALHAAVAGVTSLGSVRDLAALLGS